MNSIPNNQGSHATLGEGGVVRVTRKEWGYLDHLDLTNQWDIEVGSASGHALHFGRKGSAVFLFRSTPQGQSVEKGWLRRVDWGQALAQNERWIEVADSAEWNPTYMGAGIYPSGIATRWRAVPSPSIYHSLTTDGDSVIAAGAVIPMEFNSWPLLGPTRGHFGGDERTYAIYHNARQYQRVTTNCYGIRDVHEQVFMSYFPREWSGKDLILAVESGAFLTDDFNLASGVAGRADFFNVSSNQTTSYVEEWPNYDFLEIRHRVGETQRGFGGGSSTDHASRVEDGEFCACILSTNNWRSTGEPFAVAIAAQIHADSEGQTRATEISLAQGRDSTHPSPGEDVNSGQVLAVRNRSNGVNAVRRAGWVGHRTFFVTAKDYNTAKQKLRFLHDQKYHLTPFPWDELPDCVLDGTIHPPELTKTTKARTADEVFYEF